MPPGRKASFGNLRPKEINRVHWKTLLLVCSTALLTTAAAYGQDDYAAPTGTVAGATDNRVFRNTIRSVQLTPESAEMGMPVIPLNGTMRLRLRFDDLEGGIKIYTYTYIHCDFDWNPTNLLPSEYLEGFPEESISGREPSANTTPAYTHYSQVFPTPNLRITKSGNYLLKVYEESNTDRMVLCLRFFVVEPLVGIQANVHGATLNADRNYKQEVDFSVLLGDYPVQNAYTDVMVAVLQNQRFDNAITNLKPQFVKDGLLTYEYDDGNVFNGGNEWRDFDLKDQGLPGISVNYQRRDSVGVWHAFLHNDECRAFKRYATIRDINGAFVVRRSRSVQPNLDADYETVHFTLPLDAPFEQGDLYVTGSFSQMRCLPQYRMTWDANRKCYTLAASFKQGYYNYQYWLLQSANGKIDETAVEGNRFETENVYTILVYSRKIGFFYDRLIGYVNVGANNQGR